jgi:glutaredoxin
MIPLRDQEMIAAKFAQELAGPVKIDLFTERIWRITVPGKRPCQYCKPTEEMLREISGLHPIISLRVHHMEDKPAEAETYGVERVPAIVLRGPSMGPLRPSAEGGASPRPYLKFYGIPGDEFPSFLETISDVSRQEVLVEESAHEAHRDHERRDGAGVHDADVPVLPGCGTSRLPDDAGAPLVRSEIIEVNEYPELAERYKVTAVPLTVIADKVSIPGMVPEAKLVEEIAKAAVSAGEPTAPKRIERGKERPSGLIIP